MATTAYNLDRLPQAERLVRDLVRQWLGLTEAEKDRVGRDQLGDLGDRPWYIRVIKVPGGRSDRFGGDIALDVEVFAPTYVLADSIANDLDAFLLGYPHVVEVDTARVVIDSVTQNEGPHEIPWEDPAVNRILATYVITVRR